MFKKVGATVGKGYHRLVQLYHPGTWKTKGKLWASGLIFFTLMVFLFILGSIWSQEPALMLVTKPVSKNDKQPYVIGYLTARTTVLVAEKLLDKNGGYISNDVTPPGVFVDNIHNWEFGVLVQLRDMARALRNDFSRSQTQSIENKDLSRAEPLFNFDNDSWLFPPTEHQYRKGIKALQRYADGLSDKHSARNRFFARADNLSDWLAIVGKRLGSLSQRLSASVGKIRVNIDLAGDSSARQSGPSTDMVVVKTPWLEIDDVFYEARGSTWALIHFFKAIEVDFEAVLKKKNALVSLRHIIRELEGTQQAVWSPMVLNGDGFGVVTNYSLIMASYISRANTAVIDLRNLLVQG